MFVLILTHLALFLFRKGFCLIEEEPQSIVAPGDVVIGGLFPVHSQITDNETVPAAVTCDPNSLSIQVLLHTQVMIFAIEQINNSPLLSGVKIGYEIYDTCSHVSTALRATLKMMQINTLNETQGILPNSDANNAIKAVIGELSSEISVAVARLFALPLMTQISYGSTSELLSSRSKFPSFFRTVPSDKHQTNAIARLVKNFRFVPVGIVGSEDEYGKYGAESLSDYFTNDQICLEFKIILPEDFSQNVSKYTDIFKTLNLSRAEAIVLFTHDTNAEIILREAIKDGANRTWIASDAWSTSKRILNLDNLSKSGRILGVTCKRENVSHFSEYMDQLINQSNGNSSFFHYLLSKTCPTEAEHQNCSSFASDTENLTGLSCISKKCLMDFIKQDQSYEPHSVYMAVNIVAQGLKSVLQKCNSTHFPAWMLTETIKNLNFSLDNTTYMTLNENGEVDIGYDILQWEIISRNFTTIGTYMQDVLQLSKDVLQLSAAKNTSNGFEVTQFNCSKSCGANYEMYVLNLNNTCCKGCRQCEDNFFSEDGKQCKPCEDSNNQRCSKDQIFLEWTAGFSIALIVFAIIGFVVTLAVTALFVVYHRTPIVRAAGGYLCFPTLLSLLGCFSSAFLFIGRPTDIKCRAGLPLFSMSFTVCVSCILANLLQIFVCFTFKLNLVFWLKRINKPAVVVVVCAGVQLLMCVLWLVLWPPYVRYTDNEGGVLIMCDEGSMVMFVATQVYIALLCIVCFLFAYKGKRLPDLYKNASFITISMVIYLVVWILFIPIYTQDHGRFEGGIEASAILVSAYSILGCHFTPKCYILLWKKELNDENKIAEYIRQHYEKKGIRVIS